ncbi:MAG: DNA polymerase III subunit beta [Symploca sp. SIO3C6]|uniref:Beta sliding clamp n=1 Tax=Symploca sp. SIO1C4 TaxID=2607765 RepID=A0A6B3NGJ8_9CYAN|nr:DNA polymerase III subunit beta [Symploca sp. SIO3C6]NER30827.1 DNA polymerase III subunit beta [Symploca sp. SIO1C4]NET08715.1 DNA polymerase III subunit beta [Symploca sp. SIO2B6]
MKLVCNQSDLNTNLSLVSRAVPSRPTHPVLGNVLVEADTETQRVLLTAFDLSLGIQTSFAAQVSAGGEITIPAKLLNDIVSRLPDGEITLEEITSETESPQESDSLVVTLTTTSGRYEVRGMGSEGFPELPRIEEGMALSLPVEALMEGLRGSLFATSADETKQVLTGVHLKMEQVGENDQTPLLEFAATDGHRLAVVQTALGIKEEVDNEQAQMTDEEDLSETEFSSTALTSLELTLPARALRELEKMLGMQGAADTVALQFEQGQIVFQGGEHRLTSRTLEGQYPAYDKLIPNQFQRQITIERRALLSSLERIAVLADQKNNIVKFSIDSINQQIELSVEAQDVGSGRESISAEISGESLEIAFNVKYLLDGLKALPTSDIQIQINEADTPVILTPLGGLKMTYLIMPVQLRN